MENDTKGDYVKLLQKIHAFRADLLKQDWKDDGACIMGNRIAYKYVSADKIKQNVNPLLVKHGLEWDIEFGGLEKADPVGGFTQHWVLMGTMVLIDIDTGAKKGYHAYGEAGDSGDKGINKAQTDAFKQIIFDNFLIADHEDADGEDASEAKPAPKPKAQDAKAAVMAQGEKPKAPAPAPKPKADAPKITPKPKAPTPKPKLDVSAINRAAINQILKNAKREVEDGTMTAGEYDILSIQAERITDNDLAHDFIMDNQKGE